MDGGQEGVLSPSACSSLGASGSDGTSDSTVEEPRETGTPARLPLPPDRQPLKVQKIV